MTLRIANGEFTITRPDGTKIFDIDDKLLHVSDAVISGTLTIPAVSGGAAGSGGPGSQNLTTYYDLGAVTAGATQLIGAVKFVLTGSGNGLAYNRWHMVMGGTIVWVMDGVGTTSGGRESNGSMQQLVIYHFEINAGRARMVRRVVIATGFLYVIQAHSIQYKLRAGAWV